MFQKIAKHRANDASNDVHRPPLPLARLLRQLMSKKELKQIFRFKFQWQQLLFLLTVRILEDKVWWLESYEFFWCRPPFLGNIGSSFLHLWGHFHHWFSICVAQGLLHIPQIEAMQLVNVKGQLKFLSLMNIFFIYLPKEGALTMSIRHQGQP